MRLARAVIRLEQERVRIAGFEVVIQSPDLILSPPL